MAGGEALPNPPTSAPRWGRTRKTVYKNNNNEDDDNNKNRGWERTHAHRLTSNNAHKTHSVTPSLTLFSLKF